MLQVAIAHISLHQHNEIKYPLNLRLWIIYFKHVKLFFDEFKLLFTCWHWGKRKLHLISTTFTFFNQHQTTQNNKRFDNNFTRLPKFDKQKTWWVKSNIQQHENKSRSRHNYETWRDKNNHISLNIESYDTFHKSRETSRHGGIGFFIKELKKIL